MASENKMREALEEIKDLAETFHCELGENWRDIKSIAESALHSVEAEKEPVGLAEQMPGAPGFTMCVFNSGEVPIGTAVYTHIDSPEHKPE